MGYEHGDPDLVSPKAIAASSIGVPGSGAVLFCDADDRPTTCIRAKTADGTTRDIVPQSGTQALTLGTTALIPATITTSSRILVTQKTPGTTTNTVEYAALGTDRVVGVGGAGGGFKLTALLAAGTINTADTSTLDWLVIN